MGLGASFRHANDRAFKRAAATGKGPWPRPGETRAAYVSRIAYSLPFMGQADALRPMVSALAAEIVALRQEIDVLRKEVAAVRTGHEHAGPAT